tara:strand:+ start:1133 stop:2791 length:1659 start_codon:yes stop_codon:yes gene_type:complete
MYFNPPTGKNPSNPFYHRSIEEQRREMQEAVTVELEFKKDADGAAAVGSETGRRGLVVSGKKVKDKVYKMTFTNNATMNKFMDKYENKLNEGIEELEEAVVQVGFKDDSAGAAAVGSETSRTGLLVGGKKVKDGTYRLTFKNDRMKDKFMKKYNSKIVDAVELNESTAEYRAMMKRYKGSDMEKVFKMLRDEGFKVGEQDDTLVRNLLKRHRGNVKKVVDQIVKDYPGKFDVNRMMMDDVQVDEEKKLDSRGLGVTRQSGLGSKATARNIVKGLGDADGPFTVVAMKRDKVIKQETTKRRDMLPAIISTMRKEVGSGVTIAIEDKKGTIRNTFKESVQLDEEVQNVGIHYVILQQFLRSYWGLPPQSPQSGPPYGDAGDGVIPPDMLRLIDYDGDGQVTMNDLNISLSLSPPPQEYIDMMPPGTAVLGVPAYWYQAVNGIPYYWSATNVVQEPAMTKQELLKLLQKDAITYNNPPEDAPTLQSKVPIEPPSGDGGFPPDGVPNPFPPETIKFGKPQPSDGGPNNPPWLPPQLGMMERKTIDNFKDYIAEGTD